MVIDDALRRRRATDWASEWKGRNVGERLCDLVLHSDTTPVRFGLAIAAFFWACGLALPGDTTGRPAYRVMGAIAPDVVWSMLWAIYCYAMAWRVLTVREGSRMWPFIVNAFGLALWGITCFSNLLAVALPYPVGSAPENFACLTAAFWVFVRTHVFPRGGWRAD